MQRKIITILFILTDILAFAQNNNIQTAKKPFEGTLKFIKESISDTLYYTFYIKGNKIKFEEHDNTNIVNNCILFDLEKGSITAINPQRKLFINIAAKPFIPSNINSGYEIIKGTNTKTIQGYKCLQWRVKNKAQNTEIAYWVAINNFNFYQPLLLLWNRAEKNSLFFLQIPDTKGVLPMISEERTLLREDKMHLEVLEVKEKILDNSIFLIPKDYQAFDR